MTVSLPPVRFAPDDILKLEGEGLYELVDGKLVEKQMSSLASKTATRIIHRLSTWSDDFQRGEIYPEQSFQCFPNDADLIRRPDVAVIVAERLADVPDEGHVPIAPDLAIEVVSPN